MSDPIPPAPSVRHALAELTTALKSDFSAAVDAWLSAWRVAPAAHAASLAAGAVLLAAALAVRVVLAAPGPVTDGPLPCPLGTVAQDVAGVLTCVAEADAMTATPEAAAPVAPVVGDPLASLPPAVTRWRTEIAAAASTHGVDARLIGCVMLAESSGRPAAVSSAGALGLMQIVPKYHPAYDIRRGYDDPGYNVDFGTRFLRELLDATGNNMGLALHRYNGNGYGNGYVTGVMGCVAGRAG